jgi:Ca-activated chloride channel homolog
MRYSYGEFNGQNFPSSESLFDYGHIFDFILTYGEQAMEALAKLNPADEELLQQLIEDGMLEKAAGQFRLTPRAVNAMQRKALMEIFALLPRGNRDSHPTTTAGAGSDRMQGTRKYQFGDPISELDLNASLRNAIQRQVEKGDRPGVPINLKESDLDLHLLEGTTSCALCILIDMSGSMRRYGRFWAAKKVAMALTALVRQRFPQDTIDIVGFYSTATIVRETQLPLLVPKPISTYEYQVAVSLPLAQAAKTHQHFTNLQLGMQMGRRLLAARPAQQKIMFIITDGRPTAHVEGDTLHLFYPPRKATALATLREALHCTQADIRIASFALIEDYWDMDWVEFIDQLTRLCRGVAFYCTGENLAGCVMESYLSGKKRKAFIA